MFSLFFLQKNQKLSDTSVVFTSYAGRINPLLLEHLEKRVLPDAELQKFHCEINGLWCPACAEVIALFLL